MNVDKQILTKEDVESTKDVHPNPPTTEPPVQTDETKSIAIITCSTRPSRIGNFVAQHVTSIISSTLSASTNLRISSIDLAAHPLPLFDETAIPAGLPRSDPTPHYTTPHARAWSAEIRQHAAFIFVTPQYNWGYPASVKNALDYLYHEWGGKPAMVVSYGNRGGELAGAQLMQICKGLRMKVVERVVGYKVKVEEAEGVREKGEFGKERKEMWRGEGVDEELRKGFEEVVGFLGEGSE